MNLIKNFEWDKFQIMEDVYDVLVHIIGSTNVIGIYDVRASRKAYDKLLVLKISYGAIKYFAEYLYNIGRYFKIRENGEAIINVSKKLSGFADNYEELLI